MTKTKTAATSRRRKSSSPRSPSSEPDASADLLTFDVDELEAEPDDLDCPPRFGTRRRPDRPNLLSVARLIARILGIRMMPWQEHVVAVATEYDPETGMPYYRHVWITIPRQSGKTTIVLIMLMVRALSWGSAQRITYTAQTGQDAREKLIEDWKPILQKSAALWGVVDLPKPSPGGLITKVREQNGTEGIDFLGGSIVRVMASGKSAGHGKTLHLGIIDEAFHDTDMRRESSMIPAQNTVDDAQIIGVSTMGTADSVLLNARVAQGRKAVADERDRGMCYFEWSAPPGTDLFDEAAWWDCMPALGITISVDTVRSSIETMAADPDQGPDEARRAYLNQKTAGTRTVFQPGAWEQVISMETKPTGTLTLAADMNPDRDAASIAVADDDHAIELLEHRDGTGWLEDRLVDLAVKLNAPVVIDEGGPAGDLCDRLEKRDVVVIRAKTRDLVKSCGSFYTAVVERTIEVRDHPDAAEAVEKARKRVVSDAWAWARKVGDHDASPLVAMSLALWGTEHHPETTKNPGVHAEGVDADELAAAIEQIEAEYAEALRDFGDAA